MEQEYRAWWKAYNLSSIDKGAEIARHKDGNRSLIAAIAELSKAADNFENDEGIRNLVINTRRNLMNILSLSQEKIEEMRKCSS